MSYTQLIYFAENGDAHHGEEFGNSHGLCPHVWDAICKRYGIGGELLPYGAWELLFEKWKELPLEPWEYNVLVFTYDRAFIRREDIELLADSLERFHKAHHIDGCVDHTKGIAVTLRDALKEPTKWRGVGLYGTSVADDLWTVRLTDPEDPEFEDYGPYNIDRHDDHTVYDLLKLEP